MQTLDSHWTLWLFRTQLALIAITVVVIGIVQFGSMLPITAFLMTGLCFALIVVTGVFGAVLLLVSLFIRSGDTVGVWRRNSAIAIVIGLLPIVIVWLVAGADGLSKPPIHDITTDFENPPRFIAAVTARTAKENSLDYPGAEVAQIQREFYPNIQPIETSLTPSAAHERALAVISKLGWQLLADDKASGIIEAAEETRLFNFKDDIAIRISPRAGGSRIDLRSVSRVGQGDLGANAARIERFRAVFTQP